MSGIASAALTIAMIAVFLLIAGSIRLVTRGEHSRQGWLMLLAAMVLLGNVLVWTV